MLLYVWQVNYSEFDIVFKDCEIFDNFAVRGGVVNINDPKGKQVARRSLTFDGCNIFNNAALVRSRYLYEKSNCCSC